jgi:hypothetical protein
VFHNSWLIGAFGMANPALILGRSEVGLAGLARVTLDRGAGGHRRDNSVDSVM